MRFVSEQDVVTHLNSKVNSEVIISLEREEVKFYHTRWIDSSSISAVDLGKDFTNYQADYMTSIELQDTDTRILYSSSIIQSRKQL